MAIGTPVSHIGTGSSAATHTTASFTPQANSCLFAFVIAYGNNSVPNEPTISDSLGGTWNAIYESSYETASVPRLRGKLFYQKVTGSPAAMTVTVSATLPSGTITQIMVSLISVTGVATQFNNVVTSNSATGDNVMSLGAMAASSGAIMFSGHVGGNTITQPSGWTESQDLVPIASRRLHVAYDLTSPVTNPAISSTNAYSLAIALELPLHYIYPDTVDPIYRANNINIDAATWSNVPIGTASADRQVVVLVWTNTDTGNGAAITAATIGGVSATVTAMENGIPWEGDTVPYYVLVATVPTGTTATVTVTTSALHVSYIGAWTTSFINPVPVKAEYYWDNAVFNVPANGQVFGYTSYNGISPGAIVGLDNNIDFMTDFETFNLSSKVFPSAATGVEYYMHDGTGVSTGSKTVYAVFASSIAPAGSLTKVRVSGAWKTSVVKVYTGGTWVVKPLKARVGSDWK